MGVVYLTEKERCKKCYSDDVYEFKRWSVESPESGHVLTVRMMRCKTCRSSYRRYV